MAERGTYQSPRGVLSGVPQVQASDAPARLLGGIGEVAGQFGVQVARRSADAAESARIKLIGNSLEQTRASLAEYVAQRPDDPTVDKTMQEHINGKYRELSKTDPKGAEQYRMSADVLRRMHMIDVNKNWNQSVGEQQKGTYETARRNALALLASTDPVDAAVFVQNFNDAHAMIFSKKPDGSFNYTQAEQASKENSLLSDVVDEVVRNNIANANPDKLAVMLDGLTKRQMKIQPLEQVGMESDMYKVVGAQKMDVYAGMVRQKQYELKRQAEAVGGREKYAAEIETQQYLNGVYQFGLENPAKRPADDTLMKAYGEDYASKFSYLEAKAEAEGNAYKVGSTTPPSDRLNQKQYFRGTGPLSAFEKGADDIDALIKSDPTQAMLSADKNVQKAATDFFKGGDNVGSRRNEYVSALEHAYDVWDVAPSKRYLLTQPMLNAAINNIDGPDANGNPPTAMQKAARIQAIAAPWGNQQERVLAQVFDKGGVEGMYNVLIDMGHTATAGVFAKAIDNAPNLDKLVESVGIKPKDITDSIASDGRLQSLMNSLPVDDLHKQAWYQKSVELLSKQFVANGTAQDEAVTKAIDAIVPFEFTGVDRLVRVPKGQYNETIGAGTSAFALSTTLKQIMPDIILDDVYSASGAVSKERARQDFQDQLFRNARFVTNADGSGVNIVDSVIGAGKGNVLMVRGPDGKPRPWEKKWGEFVNPAVVSATEAAQQMSDTMFGARP